MGIFVPEKMTERLGTVDAPAVSLPTAATVCRIIDRIPVEYARHILEQHPPDENDLSAIMSGVDGRYHGFSLDIIRECLCMCCGGVLPEGARFCIDCGLALSSTGKTERLSTPPALGVTERL